MLGCFVFLKPYLRFVVKINLPFAVGFFFIPCVESKNGGIASLGSEKALGEHGGAMEGTGRAGLFLVTLLCGFYVSWSGPSVCGSQLRDPLSV